MEELDRECEKVLSDTSAIFPLSLEYEYFVVVYFNVVMFNC